MKENAVALIITWAIIIIKTIILLGNMKINVNIGRKKNSEKIFPTWGSEFFPSFFFLPIFTFILLSSVNIVE